MQKKLLVLSGISGVGKSSVIKQLTQSHDFYFAVSTTTRAMRANEINNADYNFITNCEFNDLINNNMFIEHIEFAGNQYGTTFNEITNNSKSNIVFDLNQQGYQALKKKHQHTIGIFLFHQDTNVILDRLNQRSQENKQTDLQLAQRIQMIEETQATRNLYDYVLDVTNLSIAQTTQAVMKIFQDSTK